MTMEASKVVQELDIATHNCDSHGEYQSQHVKLCGTQFWTTCPQCAVKDSKSEEQKIIDGINAGQRQVVMNNTMRRAAIPPRFMDRRFENYRATCSNSAKALEAVREYAESFADSLSSGRSLILMGTVGTGKTHLAASAAHALIAQGYTAVFTSVMAAVRSVKETYGRKEGVTERQALDALIAPDLLIVDEVGVQFGSAAEELIMFEIINGRYEQMKPTIIISNLAMEPLKKYLGERVFDRLREGGGKAVVFNWESHRAKVAA